MASNGAFAQQEQYTATSGAQDTTSSNTNGASDLSKDEIGWYFVEQYYTTLSKSPEKLHLFYGKRSQFVSGPEAEVSSVSVGRSQIQERIKDLDFQDCKVRVSNVDSQSSDDNIVIQVIGETSNKNAELKKFVQTFILAQQPSGYFVLNDIFRYIKEEDEEEVVAAGQEESASVAADEETKQDVEMPKAQAEEPASGPLDTAVVDKKLEETIEADVTEDASSTNGTPEQAAPETAEDAPAAPAVEAPSPEAAAKEVEAEVAEKAEEPKDPLPTPAVTRAPSTTKVPAVPVAPAKPMSWANRAAAAAAASAPKPVVPQVKPASPATTQTRAPPAAAAAATAAASTPAAVSAPTPNTKENEAPAQSEGWQSVGSDNAKRQNRPQSISQQPQEKEGTLGYVRNVNETVKSEDLKAALNKCGEVTYFDVNRQKNCAFVEFKDVAGYQAAAAANPHVVNGEEIFVEPRRPKQSAYGGTGFNGQRGGRGRGGFPQGAQRGRGDFNGNRGRGAPRGGRGGATPAPAAA